MKGDTPGPETCHPLYLWRRLNQYHNTLKMSVPVNSPLNQRKSVASSERSGKTNPLNASKANEKTIQNPILRKILR